MLQPLQKACSEARPHQINRYHSSENNSCLAASSCLAIISRIFISGDERNRSCSFCQQLGLPLEVILVCIRTLGKPAGEPAWSSPLKRRRRLSHIWRAISSSTARISESLRLYCPPQSRQPLCTSTSSVAITRNRRAAKRGRAGWHGRSGTPVRTREPG